MRYPVTAVCQKCSGTFVLSGDLGSCSAGLEDRLWKYECAKCGRIVVSPARIPSTLDLPGEIFPELER